MPLNDQNSEGPYRTDTILPIYSVLNTLMHFCNTVNFSNIVFSDFHKAHHFLVIPLLTEVRAENPRQ